MAKDDARQAAEANRLYWSNEASVGEISTRIGISRRALYEVLEPRPAGLPCPQCGTATVFVNRSALTSGTARCPSCDTETDVTAAREDRTVVPAAQPVGYAHSNGLHIRARPLALGGVALIGIVIGAIAALVITRRD